MNDAVGALCRSGRLSVLSYCEGEPLKLVGLLPKMLVVPAETAFPGYGTTVTLPHADHIDTCKPPSREDPAYAELLRLIRGVHVWEEERAPDLADQTEPAVDSCA